MNLGFLRRNRELNHERAREWLSSYIDRQLSSRQMAELELHLRSCEGCRDELRALRATRQLLHGLPQVRLPRSFTLQAAPRPIAPPRAFFYLRTATAMATAAFVALLAASTVLPMAGMPDAAPMALESRPAAPAAAADVSTASRQEAPAAMASEPQRPAPRAAPEPGARAFGAPPPPAAAAAAPAQAPKAAAPPADAPATAPAAAAASPAQAEGQPADSEATMMMAPAREPALAAGLDAAAEADVAEKARAAESPVVAPEPATSPAAEITAAQAPATSEPAGDVAAAPPSQRIDSAAQPGSLSAILSMLQTAAGGLAALLALATGTLWLGHRRSSR